MPWSWKWQVLLEKVLWFALFPWALYLFNPGRADSQSAKPAQHSTDPPSRGGHSSPFQYLYTVFELAEFLQCVNYRTLRSWKKVCHRLARSALPFSGMNRSNVLCSDSLFCAGKKKVLLSVPHICHDHWLMTFLCSFSLSFLSHSVCLSIFYAGYSWCSWAEGQDG